MQRTSHSLPACPESVNLCVKHQHSKRLSICWSLLVLRLCTSTPPARLLCAPIILMRSRLTTDGILFGFAEEEQR
eukprot:scaffold227643_cov47-Prasinocladus_malaysianus.AAC.1